MSEKKFFDGPQELIWTCKFNALRKKISSTKTLRKKLPPQPTLNTAVTEGSSEMAHGNL